MKDPFDAELYFRLSELLVGRHQHRVAERVLMRFLACRAGKTPVTLADVNTFERLAIIYKNWNEPAGRVAEMPALRMAQALRQRIQIDA